jgi:hypothetical protein
LTQIKKKNYYHQTAPSSLLTVKALFVAAEVVELQVPIISSGKAALKEVVSGNIS